MVAYDSFSSDDEEEQCPLCIEDMDITDKHFKPCPCGFQICQFCYNNIRSGPEQYNRCPACRRQYDDESIEYKKFSPEDLKREQERKQRKELERKNREREKLKEHIHHDQRDKKHLASMRVIQKNLVYVIGLNPSIPSDELQAMLKRDEYFGQYGKIQKIVVNKRVNGNGNPGVGVYVTFARKEDAAQCIAAVDGSINDGKYLRAAYGTTKYCSSYLRGQTCPNPNCMFLHEPGEEADSFNRHPNHSSNSASTTSHNNSSVATLATQQTPPHINKALSNSPQPSNAPISPAINEQYPSYHGSAGSMSGGSSGSANATQSGNSGATLTAANAPVLPAWGKVAPQIPTISKLTDQDLPDSASETFSLLDSIFAKLNSNNWKFEFTSYILEATTQFPPMFSLPMDDKRRLKVYQKAVVDLENSASVPETDSDSLNSGRSKQSSSFFDDSETNNQGELRSASESPHSGKKLNNGQHLLAQLMRNNSVAGSDRPDEDVNSKPTTEYSKTVDVLSPTDSRHNSEETPDIEKPPKESLQNQTFQNHHSQDTTKNPELLQNSESLSRKPKIDVNAALNVINASHTESKFGLNSQLAETLRKVGSDLMQPAPQITGVSISYKEAEFPSSYLVDDGPSFDLKQIPKVALTGDVKPSVWSAIEDFTKLRETLALREKEFVTAKSQTKKRIKKIRI